MKLARWTIQRLKNMPRPPGYVEEVLRCAIQKTDTAVVVDVHSPCIQALKAKYRRSPRPHPVVAGAVGHDSALSPWQRLHRRAISVAEPIDVDAELRWLDGFRRFAPCGEGRRNWDALLKETPPDFSSRDAYFAWTVKMHNGINAKSGKPEKSVADAMAEHVAYCAGGALMSSMV